MIKLTQAEEEIMMQFWKHGPNTVSALIGLMEEPKPPHSTISSIARILEKKGYISHKTFGRTYEYYPLITQRDYKRFFLKNLAGNYFNGSFQQLVSFLVKEEHVDAKDLKKLIDTLEKKSS